MARLRDGKEEETGGGGDSGEGPWPRDRAGVSILTQSSDWVRHGRARATTQPQTG